MELQEQQAKAWSLAPDDAKWIAQDKDGYWYAYGVEPIIVERFGDMFGAEHGADEYELFGEEINGWNWKDTLQSREEFEAMTSETEQQFQGELNALAERMDEEVLADKWVPEIGQECEYRPSKSAAWTRVKVVAIHRGYSWLDYVDNEGSEPYTVGLGEFRPIQTEADKKRESQIAALNDVIRGIKPQYLAQVMYDEIGVRVIAPDEFVVKALSDEQFEKIKSRFCTPMCSPAYVFNLVDAVQRELGIPS